MSEEEKWLKYRRLQTLTIILIIVGIGIIMGLQWAIGTLGYIPKIKKKYSSWCLILGSMKQALGVYNVNSLKGAVLKT